MFKTFDADRNWIENKYHRVGEPFNPYNRMAYHGHDYDETSGKSDEDILKGLRTLSRETEELSHPIAKARAIEYVLENTRIDVNEHDYFIGLYSWNRLLRETTVLKWKTEVFDKLLPEVGEAMKDFNDSGAMAIWPDFDHVVPDWDALMKLGFSGIRQRARDYREAREKKIGLSDKERDFFDAIELEYTAIINFVDRLYKYASSKEHEKAKAVADCLLQLRDGAPTNIYEAMQLIFLYFMISESVDHYQVRSLGNGLDYTLYPFYKNDIERGRFTEGEIRELFAYFMMQWSAIGNYWGQPFYLGGTNEQGGTLINELSYLIVDVYDELGIYNPKIQIKYNKNIPERFLFKVFDMIRRGKSCFTFCCEENYIRAVMSYGATYEEARTMDIRGCYETGVRANEVSAATGYVNPLKAVRYVFSNGYEERLSKQMGPLSGEIDDSWSFEDFKAAFFKQYAHIIDEVIRLANAYDPYMEYINPSSLYSATITTSLENAFDGYGGGVKYNNSSALLCGLGTATDAIMAVKYLVYEQNSVSLTELKRAIDSNWEGYEELRLKALRCPYKYGNNVSEADECAKELSDFFVKRVEGKKNGRGGVYKALLHSAMQFVWQGEKTGATPDGRLAGEEISKSASPTPGMDKKGVTALILSATKLEPYTYSEAFCLDVMLHPTAVSGDEGLSVMRSLIDVYAARGGMVIQFNVFDAKVLREAQKYPKKYENLQVRVCGWNVLFNNLSRAEQNAYIARAENLS